MSDDSRKVPLCGLWENTSKDGAVYFSGSLGSAKILVFKNNRKTQQNHPSFNVYIVPNEKKNANVSYVKKAASYPEQIAENLSEYSGFDENSNDVGF